MPETTCAWHPTRRQLLYCVIATYVDDPAKTVPFFKGKVSKVFIHTTSRLPCPPSSCISSAACVL